MARGAGVGGTGAGRAVLCAALVCVCVCACVASAVSTEAIIEDELRVTVVPFGSAASGEALGALVQGALGARGVRARVLPPPASCATPDARACLFAALAGLARGALDVALVPAGGAALPAFPILRDAGLENLGAAAPPAHRACYLLPAPAPGAPPLRSLLELDDAEIAARYALPEHVLRAITSDSVDDDFRYENINASARGVLAVREHSENATIVTTDEGEAVLLRALVRQLALHVRVVPASRALPRLLRARALPALVCGRALDPTLFERAGAYALSPPACLLADCPFEARLLIKLVNVRSLAHTPSAMRVLVRLALDESELRALERRALAVGAEQAAREALAAHPAWLHVAPEVRVAALVPASTRREAYDVRALRAAAELAEVDEAGAAGASFDYKVELVDDACSGSRAFKYLTDSLGTEFGALSAVAGPACGAAFGDVVRQSAALTLPVLAYNAQAPPAGAGLGARMLLAAGDGRRPARALGALLARQRWRRVAVLSELATRAVLEPAHLGATVLVHVELPGGAERVEQDLVLQWAEDARGAGARVLYVSVEDARATRAALCAGRGAGLVPRAGAVWLLDRQRAPGWLHPGATDTHNCTLAELQEVAEGHLTAMPAWQLDWRAPPAWQARWRARCERGSPPGTCRQTPPSPHAALLYDTLRLWAAALRRLLNDHPNAVDDLHRHDLMRQVVEDAALAPYTGVTGSFEWENVGGVCARRLPLALLQWRNGSAALVGNWSDGALALDEAALRWGTPDGRAPDDGTERCALQPLAAALHADCSVAYAVTAALPLAALAALFAAGAWRWRRRAEREYRARVVAVGMRALGPKPGVPDRWEVPREHVVINRKIGTGAFGTVYGGHALLSEDRGWTAVAVKTLKAGASTEEKLDFLAEAEAMKRFEHENVIRLLGVVTETKPVCTVMEFMLYGDLKGYLLGRRHLAGEEEVAPARLTRMALDVARALAYLVRMRYVHRDVAARNCLVSAARRVKLADFGMTRLVFEHDYYRFGRKGMLPVRWMAPESLALGVFSPASDVWSFGVLLYEIVTFGALPFQGLSNAQVLARVKAGRPLDLPRGLKPQLEALIESCWRRDKRARPSVDRVAALLAESPRLLAPCLDMPLDALPLHLEPGATEQTQARWVSWGAPPSAGTDSTYLSAEGAPPQDTDAFLPPRARDVTPP